MWSRERSCVRFLLLHHKLPQTHSGYNKHKLSRSQFCRSKLLQDVASFLLNFISLKSGVSHAVFSSRVSEAEINFLALSGCWQNSVLAAVGKRSLFPWHMASSFSSQQQQLWNILMLQVLTLVFFRQPEKTPPLDYKPKVIPWLNDFS